jgi:hypothetical protein
MINPYDSTYVILYGNTKIISSDGFMHLSALYADLIISHLYASKISTSEAN